MNFKNLISVLGFATTAGKINWQPDEATSFTVTYDNGHTVYYPTFIAEFSGFKLVLFAEKHEYAKPPLIHVSLHLTIKKINSEDEAIRDSGYGELRDLYWHVNRELTGNSLSDTLRRSLVAAMTQ